MFEAVAVAQDLASSSGPDGGPQAEDIRLAFDGSASPMTAKESMRRIDCFVGPMMAVRSV